MTDRQRGILEMTAAMLISGSIGWFVLMAGQLVLEVVFWRCLIGAAASMLRKETRISASRLAAPSIRGGAFR